MGDILIRGVSEAMKTSLSERAARNGRSLSEEAKIRLRKSLESDRTEPEFANAYDAIRSAFVGAGGGGGEFAEAMKEVEAESKRDFGRSPGDFG
ncbi:MAG: TraY domain-containing protein [Hyphomicrobiales bacterium]|jgi:plasmid stability protein|nr:TraY domain-containing protein [Hyphomicrobiales bacterium]